MGTGAKIEACWRCGGKYKYNVVERDYQVIVLNAGVLEGLDIRLKVPVNTCDSCLYALKLGVTRECGILRMKEKRKDDEY